MTNATTDRVPVEIGSTPTGGNRTRTLVSAASSYQSGGLLAALVLLFVAFSLSSPAFFTSANLTVILLQVATTGVIAIPAAMLLLAGYIDLSVGAVAWLSAAVFGIVVIDHDVNVLAAALLAIAVGAGWGTINGYLTTRLGASPIVVTLAGFACARGIGDLITNKEVRTSFGEEFSVLGNGRVLNLPVPAMIFLALFAVGAYLWYLTPVGRHLTGIGADTTAARAIGVSVRLLPFWVYVATGAAAGLTGLILVSQLNVTSPSIGVGLELQVLTAILLGGVSFQGGRGSLWGVLFGVLFTGVLANGLILLNVGPFFVNVAVGAVLFVVALLDVAYQRLEKVPVSAAPATPRKAGKNDQQEAAK